MRSRSADSGDRNAEPGTSGTSRFKKLSLAVMLLAALKKISEIDSLNGCGLGTAPSSHFRAWTLDLAEAWTS